MKTSGKNGQLIGILGGGQLALMLCTAAKQLGLTTRVFATSKEDPAIDFADGFQLGSFQQSEDLTKLFAACDVIIFENEFIPEPVLNAAAAKAKVALYPSAATMASCADKLEQKLTFQKLGLPSAPFLAARPGEDIERYLSDTQQAFPKGFVIKWAKGGYDGGGVFLCQDRSNLQGGRNFISDAFTKGSAVYAEGLVIFDQEVALVAVRGLNGEFAAYPLVGTIQENQICTSVTAPAFPHFWEKAATRAKTLGEALDLVGVFAVEYFVTNGELMINEMAPRVHNSGHATMDGVATSQFENHLRAISGMELGSLAHKPLYGMINILGPDGYNGPLNPPTIDLKQTRLHWYHKKESRPGRKIGHLNFWVETDDSAAFTELMQNCQMEISNWQQTVRSI